MYILNISKQHVCLAIHRDEFKETKKQYQHIDVSTLKIELTQKKRTV